MPIQWRTLWSFRPGFTPQFYRFRVTLRYLKFGGIAYLLIDLFALRPLRPPSPGTSLGYVDVLVENETIIP